PETGRLALYLLGLRATCPPLEPRPQRSLVTWLKYYLEEDWAGSRQHGRPLTSYYQYSLGILALCVHRKRVREEVIYRLLAAERHGRIRPAGGSAVDTEAVAALAFTCLERERLVRSRLAAELRAARRQVRKRMVEAQGPDGFFGNVYSTPWAMQVGAMCQGPPGWGVGAGTCGEWRGRSWCGSRRGEVWDTSVNTLMPASPEPLPEMLGNMTVQLVVECPLLRCPQHWQVLVPAGASLLDVLRAASAQEPHDFTFDTQDTLQGPFLSMVLGLEAQQQKRRYWQLLSAPSTNLQMGVAEYRPHDGETLILRLSEW
ncbi:TCO2 protein, partial [Chloroceryle aenea]|nr:TCO2 protein [Chloroceryle aenea]